MAQKKFSYTWIKIIIALSIAYIVSPPPILNLIYFNPVTSALITRRNIESFGTRVLNPFNWKKYKNISPNLIKYVLTSEDASFFRHKGIDPEQISEAIKGYLYKKKKLRGASTITQQVVKNLYLSEGFNPLRKLREIFWALILEKITSKQKILEIYLNIIEFGPNIYGVTEASNYYFKIRPIELNSYQALKLAAIIPNPLTVFNPNINPKRVERRIKNISNKLSSN
jgi:monofunctional biosynthetic peptidoglycan transglycosylase